jgi:hypothetical protein
LILYLRDSKNSTKKLLEIINSFSKVAGYKINKQKPVAQTKKEIREIILLTIASITIQYLGIN